MYDMHSHTEFSDDGAYSIDEMMEAAIAAGLKGCAITDHYDPGYQDPDFPFTIDFDRYHPALEEAVAKYRGRLDIVRGIEMGIMPSQFEEARQQIHSYPYDFVIGSFHCLVEKPIDLIDYAGLEFADRLGMDVPVVSGVEHLEYAQSHRSKNNTYLDNLNARADLNAVADSLSAKAKDRNASLTNLDAQSTNPVKQTMPLADLSEEYKTQLTVAFYENMYNCLKEYKCYDIVGHVTIIDRYIGGIVDLAPAMEIIRETLKMIIDDGKGIEINTSSFKYKMPVWLPRAEVLAAYRELGGEILTFGSDSHTPATYADHFREAEGLARDLGFRYWTTFKNRTPEFHRL